METVEEILARYKNIRNKMQPTPVAVNRALEFRPQPKQLKLEQPKAVLPVPKERRKRSAEKAINQITNKASLVELEPKIKMRPACLKPIEIEDPIRFHQIVDWVSQKTSYSKSELLSVRRDKDLVLARHLIWQIAKRVTSLSYTQMGNLFAHRDHTTILHAVRKTPANINLIVQEMLSDIRREKIMKTDIVARLRYYGDIEAADRIEELEALVSYLAGTNTDHVSVLFCGNPIVCSEIVAKARVALGEKKDD